MKSIDTKYYVNDRIIDLMKNRGIDEIILADAIGKDKSSIYRITRKDTVPSKTTVKLIAEKYGVDFDTLLTGRIQPDKYINAGSNSELKTQLLEFKIKGLEEINSLLLERQDELKERVKELKDQLKKQHK